MKKIVLIMLLFPSVAFADKRIDKFIEVIGIEDNLKVVLENVKSNTIYGPISDVNPEYKKMTEQHNQEKIGLYEKHFDPEKIRIDIAHSIKNTYSEKELDELYKFISTEVGSSVFKKYESIGVTFRAAFNELYKAYAAETVELLERQGEESRVLVAKIEKNMPKESSEEDDKEHDKGLSIGEIVRFMVATENGKMVGYKVREGIAPGLFEKTPFEKDDIVIAINGIQVNEPEKVREVYEMLKSFDQVHFEVLRNGEITDFVIVISEIVNN